VPPSAAANQESFPSPGLEAGGFAYRDPRLPAGWWVSVEQVGGSELRYGFHSPRGDRLRSPSEVAHYLQACRLCVAALINTVPVLATSI
jgi:hypothetical protein